VIRLPRGSRLVIASHNKGKLREIEELLAPHGLTVIGASTLGLPEPEETGTSFAENAKLKAEAAALASGLPALADDSGLCVAALNGAPGIHSARWAGETKDFRLAMKRVEDEMGGSGNPGKRANFVCALALAAPNAETEVFEGRVYGALTFPPRGDRGFGYDPIFVPEGYRFTFGEMAAPAKHAISHRARAFEKFSRAVFHPGTEQ
jgi:XTP/dITP diphosphohydrolase